MYGMGQTSAQVVMDWAAVERFARNAAGGIFTAVFPGDPARYTRALQALAENGAIRAQAQYFLAQPPARHRQGLLETAEYARRAGLQAAARTAGARAAASVAAGASTATPMVMGPRPYGAIVGAAVPVAQAPMTASQAVAAAVPATPAQAAARASKLASISAAAEALRTGATGAQWRELEYIRPFFVIGSESPLHALNQINGLARTVAERGGGSDGRDLLAVLTTALAARHAGGAVASSTAGAMVAGGMERVAGASPMNGIGNYVGGS